MKTTTKTNTFFGIIAALIAVIFTLAAFTACTNPAEDPKRTPDPWEWEAVTVASDIPSEVKEWIGEVWSDYLPYLDIKGYKSISIVKTDNLGNSANDLISVDDNNNLTLHINVDRFGVARDGIDSWLGLIYAYIPVAEP
jgi:hypothetical protein